MPIWFRKDGGIWNNDVSANPATNTGGIPMDFHPNANFITCSGSDMHFIFNFGASAFTYAVPTGFTPGWPDGTGWATLDPAKVLNGSLDPGNLSFHGASGSFSQTTSSHLAGAYYYEYENVFNTFFTFGNGSGISDDGEIYPPGCGIVGGGLGAGFIQQSGGGAFQINPIFPVPSITENGAIISVAVVLEPFTITGVSGHGEAGTMGVSIVNHAIMEMTGLYGTELSKSTGNNNMSLRWSDDGGNTWSSPLVQSMGDTGQTNISVIFQQLGYSRDRVFEISWAADGKTALSGVFVNAKKAES